jgi:hypothetical protein
MPYLSCGSCELTLYNPSTVPAPERCPRCTGTLAVAGESPRGTIADEVADWLRDRAARRGREPGQAD